MRMGLKGRSYASKFLLNPQDCFGGMSLRGGTTKQTPPRNTVPVSRLYLKAPRQPQYTIKTTALPGASGRNASSSLWQNIT